VRPPFGKRLGDRDGLVLGKKRGAALGTVGNRTERLLGRAQTLRQYHGRAISYRIKGQHKKPARETQKKRKASPEKKHTIHLQDG